jgi:hypothetical protein
LRVSSGRDLGNGSFRGRKRNYVPPTLPDGQAKVRSRSKEQRRQRAVGSEARSQDLVQSPVSDSPISNTSDAPHGPDAPPNRRAAADDDASHSEGYSNFVIPLSGTGDF